jgi:thiamine-phosphate pyrophosphorylase
MAMKQLAGLYLVIDPSQEHESLLKKLQAALKGGVDMVQIWDHWPKDQSKEAKLKFIQRAKKLTTDFQVPLLMNQDWELALETGLDGVHFDQLPADFPTIQSKLKGKYIGLTVTNNMEAVQMAEQNNLSYISFCSVFPSPSVDSCDIVQTESIKKAKEISSMPIFLSGGINQENFGQLKALPFNGIAVISGILNEADPESAAKKYKEKLQN